MVRPRVVPVVHVPRGGVERFVRGFRGDVPVWKEESEGESEGRREEGRTLYENDVSHRTHP